MNQYGYCEVMKRVESFVEVDDNWCSNYPGNTVKVTLTLFGGYVKFCVWGADDHGVEMECPVASESVWMHWKEYIYDRIPDVVNMEWFFERGFYPA